MLLRSPKPLARRVAGQRQTFEPPGVLAQPLAKSIVETALLFSLPKIREVKGEDLGFGLRLEGDFAAGENYWQTLAQ